MSKIKTCLLPTFKKANAHFLKKYQTHPNAIIYDLNLTSDALRLILALNALPESWDIRQQDIQERLNFSPERITKSIKCAQDAGYLRVTQKKGEKGRFSRNCFVFDVYPNFEHYEDQHNMHKIKEKSTVPHFPSTENAEPSVLHDIDSNRLEQTEPKLRPNQQPEIVCSFLPSNEEEERKIKILEPYGCKLSSLKYYMKFLYEELVCSIAAFEQYKISLNKKGERLDDPLACLHKAIHERWKINLDEKEKNRLFDQLLFDMKKLKQINIDLTESYVKKYQNKFNDIFGIMIGNDAIYLKNGPNNSTPLALTDQDFEIILNYYIDSKI